MSFLSRLFTPEKRSKSVRLSDPYLAELFGMRGGFGSYVDPQRAGGIAVAQACINIVAQSLAAVPLNVYRRTDNGGRERASDHPLYDALHHLANPQQTAFEVREYLVASLLTAGNAYARLTWNGRGQVFEIHPLNPGLVTVERLDSGRLRYKVSRERGVTAGYLQDEILHLRYRLDRDGVMGLSPIQMARETFSLAISQQEAAGKQADKGFRAEGALVFPQSLSLEGHTKALAELGQKFESNLSTSGVLILDGGVEWKPFSLSAKDAEFLESRKLTNLDICRVFGVPPSSAGITDNSTYSNIGEESRALVARCLAPMAKRIEQAMNAALLPATARKSLFIEHDLAGLLRGDLAARYTAYRTGRDGGWLSVNEIRGWENLKEIDGGDVFLEPLNMAQAGARGSAE